MMTVFASLIQSSDFGPRPSFFSLPVAISAPLTPSAGRPSVYVGAETGLARRPWVVPVPGSSW